MIPLLILAPLIVLAAAGAVWKARPVHAALLLSLALTLLGALYLVLGAEFIGLVQFMVYVGGIAVLIVFALLITRPGDEAEELAWRSRSLATGLVCVVPVLALLLYVFSRGVPAGAEEAPAAVGLEKLGTDLFTTGLPAVLALAVLLTAVLLGAAVFVHDFEKKPPRDP